MGTRKKINLQLTITLVIILLITITGTTYAYFSITSNTNNATTGNMATVTLDLKVTKIYPQEDLTYNNVMVPQLSTTSALGSALQGGCVDQNRNIACQVYKIELENQSSGVTQEIDGSISFFGNSEYTTNIATIMPNLKWKLVTSVDETTPENSIIGTNAMKNATSSEQKFAENITMNPNDKFSFYFIVWINEINSSQDDNSTSVLKKNFYGKVTATSSNGTGVTAVFD